MSKALLNLGLGTIAKQKLVFEILKSRARRHGLMVGEGTIEIMPDGYGFLRSPEYSYLASPDDVYVSFRRSKVCDHSAIEAVHNVSEKYRALGKRLHLTHLDPACSKVLTKAGDLVETQYFGNISAGH